LGGENRSQYQIYFDQTAILQIKSIEGATGKMFISIISLKKYLQVRSRKSVRSGDDKCSSSNMEIKAALLNNVILLFILIINKKQKYKIHVCKQTF